MFKVVLTDFFPYALLSRKSPLSISLIDPPSLPDGLPKAFVLHSYPS